MTGTSVIKDVITARLIPDFKVIKTYELTNLLPDVLLNFDSIQKQNHIILLLHLVLVPDYCALQRPVLKK